MLIMLIVTYDSEVWRDIYMPGFDIALALCRLLTMLLFFPGCWFKLFRSAFLYVHYMVSGIG